MIIIDYSQTVISNLMAEIGNRKDIDIEVDLIRHMVLNSIRSYKVKFGREYGDIVIACDSKKYWRKEQFKYYKANRKKAREESGYNWPLIFDTINLIKSELTQFFPYKVIEIEGAEADDVIATLAKWSADNDFKEGTLVPEPNPLLIVSGDHDFIQLQQYRHVKQYSPIHKKFIKAESSPSAYILEHIIRGDKGDGVPNVLSSDDSIVNGERQKKIMTTKMEQWIKDPSSMPQDDTFKRNFARNKMLVDLSQIPSNISEEIINTFVNLPNKDKSQLLNYFISNRMKMMMEHIGEF